MNVLTAGYLNLASVGVKWKQAVIHQAYRFQSHPVIGVESNWYDLTFVILRWIVCFTLYCTASLHSETAVSNHLVPGHRESCST